MHQDRPGFRRAAAALAAATGVLLAIQHAVAIADARTAGSLPTLLELVAGLSGVGVWFVGAWLLRRGRPHLGVAVVLTAASVTLVGVVPITRLLWAGTTADGVDHTWPSQLLRVGVPLLGWSLVAATSVVAGLTAAVGRPGAAWRRPDGRSAPWWLVGPAVLLFVVPVLAPVWTAGAAPAGTRAFGMTPVWAEVQLEALGLDPRVASAPILGALVLLAGVMAILRLRNGVVGAMMLAAGLPTLLAVVAAVSGALGPDVAAEVSWSGWLALLGGLVLVAVGARWAQEPVPVLTLSGQ